MKSFNDKGSRPSEIKLHSQQAFQTAFFQTASSFCKTPFPPRLRGCGRYSEMQEKTTQNCILQQRSWG
jgi:hypothetical protein